MADEIISNVPDDQLQIVLSDLQFEGIELREASKQSDGTWTLTVRASSEPEEKKHTVRAAVVPQDWMPDCKMERIVVHWTGGPYMAGDHDRECYHILIQGDGSLVRGDHSIDDNAN